MPAARTLSMPDLLRSTMVATFGALFLVAALAGAALAQGRGADAIRTEDRFNALERQNAALTGQVEQLQFKIQQLQQQIERMQADYDFRLSQLEGKGGTRPVAQPAPRPGVTPASPGVAPPPAPSAPALPPASQASAPPSSGGTLGPAPSGGGSQMAAATPAGTDLYEVGFNQMQDKDYAGAERSFRGFLQANPRHALAGNAQFWIGEIYFLKKDYVNASIAYAEGARNYPKSPKGPENLLQLGRSLALTNQVREACVIWDKLGREHPGAGDLIRQRAAAERQRYKCA